MEQSLNESKCFLLALQFKHSILRFNLDYDHQYDPDADSNSETELESVDNNLMQVDLDPQATVTTCVVASPESLSRAVSRSITTQPPSNSMPSMLSRESGPVGISRTMKFTHVVQQSVWNGAYTVNPRKWDAFVTKVLGLDPDAKLSPDNPLQVFHSDCQKWVNVAVPGDFARFKAHHEKCTETKRKRVKKHGQTLESMRGFVLKRTSRKPSPPRPIRRKVPCGGLTSTNDSRIPEYVTSVSVISAGGLSYYGIAMRLFGRPYSELSPRQRRIADIEQTNSRRWLVDHKSERVQAKDCIFFAIVDDESLKGTCERCLALLRLKAFRNALGRQRSSDPSKFKHINRRFLESELAKLVARYRGLDELLDQVRIVFTPS